MNIKRHFIPWHQTFLLASVEEEAVILNILKFMLFPPCFQETKEVYGKGGDMNMSHILKESDVQVSYLQ